VSPTAAESLRPDSRLDGLAVRLRAHEWVQDVRFAARGAGRTRTCAGAASPIALVVPSPAGLRALRCNGKQALVSAWKAHLQGAEAPQDPGFQWTLVDVLPSAGRESEVADRAAAREPVVLDLRLDPASRRIDCDVLIPLELAVFRGHFPSAPIVPGVLQVGWAADLARVHGLVAGSLTAIPTAKFRRLVQPGMRLRLRLEADPRGGVQFEYRLGERVVSTGRLQFGSDHA